MSNYSPQPTSSDAAASLTQPGGLLPSSIALAFPHVLEILGTSRLPGLLNLTVREACTLIQDKEMNLCRLWCIFHPHTLEFSEAETLSGEEKILYESDKIRVSFNYDREGSQTIVTWKAYDKRAHVLSIKLVATSSDLAVHSLYFHPDYFMRSCTRAPSKYLIALQEVFRWISSHEIGYKDHPDWRNLEEVYSCLDQLLEVDRVMFKTPEHDRLLVHRLEPLRTALNATFAHSNPPLVFQR